MYQHWFQVVLISCSSFLTLLAIKGWSNKSNITLFNIHGNCSDDKLVGSPFKYSLKMLGKTKMMFGFGRGCWQNLSVTLLQTILQFSITDNQHVLFITRHQTNLKVLKIRTEDQIEILLQSVKKRRTKSRSLSNKKR